MNQAQLVRVSAMKDGINPLKLRIPAAALDIKSSPVCEMTLLSDVSADVTLAKNGAEVFVNGEVSFRAALKCADCGIDFEHDYNEPISVEFYHAIPVHAGQKIHELSEDELERTFYDGDEIDLLPAIRDTVLLAVPIAPLCRPDCKGVCLECGANLNEEECHCCESTNSRPVAVSSNN
jgi:uncharacterized protein